jgi:CRISPR/Cas system-associated exonuclease Cas4 (RecB family)
VTFTLGAFLRFSQCGHRYWLQDVEGVQVLPRARQAVSQAVRRAIHADLTARMETGSFLSTQEARQSIEMAVRLIVSSGVDYTPQEVTLGQSRASDAILFAATRMYMMWRAVVASKVEPVSVGKPFSLELAGHSITGTIDIEEAGLVRITKVRGRRPEAHETENDIGALISTLAAFHPIPQVEVDFLIDHKEAGLVRQQVEINPQRIAALEERVMATAQAVEAGVFLPAETGSWKCASCPLRQVCRFV